MDIVVLEISKGGWVNLQARGERVQKNPIILWAYLMEALLCLKPANMTGSGESPVGTDSGTKQVTTAGGTPVREPRNIQSFLINK